MNLSQMSFKNDGTNFVKLSPLRQAARDISELRVSEDGLLSLQVQLEKIANFLIQKAAKNAHEEGNKTIMQRHVQGAFDEFIAPHEALRVASEHLLREADKSIDYYASLVAHNRGDNTYDK